MDHPIKLATRTAAAGGKEECWGNRPLASWRRSAAASGLPDVLALLNLVFVLGIVWVDWLTPAGVVVGIFLGIPIILSSFRDDPRQIWSVCLVAIVGFIIAAIFGRGPISPAQVWVPNRVFAFATLPASGAIALLLQRRRREAERARDEALSARDLNSLLMSLLAHDLRTPLVLASQGLEYVDRSVSEGRPIDRALLHDLEARLQRSLRAVEIVLSIARESLHPTPAGPHAPVALAAEIAAEAHAFSHEAEAGSKRLVLRLDPLEEQAYRCNRLALRQAVAVLLDNAIRYAIPGDIEVLGSIEGSELIVRIADRGPGLSAARASRETGTGSGLGLDLARALAVRAGGQLVVERDAPDGSCIALRLPVERV